MDAQGRTFKITSVLVAIMVTAPALCAEKELNEAKAKAVKAAYLFNFAKFVTWPDNVFDNDRAPFVIGVMNVDPIAGVLKKTVEKKRVHGRPIEVRRFSGTLATDLAGMKECHILFARTDGSRQRSQVLARLRGAPVLVVGDEPDFARQLGSVGFVLQDQRIIFEINRAALEASKLKASAKLLNLARIVSGS